jgi:hypothetical protein
MTLHILYQHAPKKHPEDHDPMAYAREHTLPVDDLLREAGLDTWARGVVHREMAERQ